MRRKKYAERKKIPKNLTYKGEIKICPICGKTFMPKNALAN